MSAPAGRPPDAAPSERLWSVQETSHYLSIPVATLYRWRQLGGGPRSYRVGRHLRYDPAEVRQWLSDKPERSP